jgi:soluble lytic murein transglycosylase-like protein
MRARLATVLLLAVLAGLVASHRARADIYQWTDGDGVVHYTNIPPKGANKKKYRKVMDEKPERGTKAAARRGACGGCDPVPARDRSKERLHRYDEYIVEASELYKIPVALIRAVITTESDYDPHVVSSAGARGLMQLMPAAQSDMGVEDVFDPRENILGGTRLLRVNANRYDGDIVLTIAAYHAGPGSLKKFGNTVPPYTKTRQYLKMVLDRYYKYKAAETVVATTP